MHLFLADDGNRRGEAPADARDLYHPSRSSNFVRQLGIKPLRAGHLTGYPVANPYGNFRRLGLPFLHDVEVMVEGCRFVDFGLREFHFLGKRRQMTGAQMSIPVLDQVQEFNQQVAIPGHVPDQRPNLGPRFTIDLTAFWIGVLISRRIHNGSIWFFPRETGSVRIQLS